MALGTGCADGTAALLSEGGKLLRKLEGHTDRLGRVAFHPMGHHFVSGYYCCCMMERFDVVGFQGVQNQNGALFTTVAAATCLA